MRILSTQTELPNSVGDINELAYVKQIGDQDISRGNPTLDVDSYLELLLSACLANNKNHATSMKHKRNVYTTMVGEYNDIHSDDISGNERYYEAFTVDTDISEVLAYASNLRPQNGKPDNFLPRDEWNKLTSSQKEALIARRRAEQQAGGVGSRKHPSQHRRQVSMHNIDSFVNLDDIIDYIVFHHGIHDSLGDTALDNNDSHKEDTLLTYMAARANPNTYPGDIRRVLGSSHAPSPQKNNLNVNEVQNTPDSVTVGDVQYYLNKGETIAVHDQHYSDHMTVVQYCIGQHNITTMDKALVDCGANGEICGADMLVLEGNERYVDVSGLAGHKVNQLRVVTARALITTHKGDAIATFRQMTCSE
jgi:hypothetical protein